MSRIVEGNEWLDVKQAAHELGYTERYIRSFLSSGRLIGNKRNKGKWLISRSELDRFKEAIGIHCEKERVLVETIE